MTATFPHRARACGPAEPPIVPPVNRPRAGYRRLVCRCPTDVDISRHESQTRVESPEARLQAHLGAGYAIQAELGGGGMSRVFVADEIALGRRVVIKLLHPALAATVSAERFQREILLVASLNHPNIVPVLSAGEVDGLPYFIMPYISGESLRARITRGPLSVRETIGVFKDVARALAYAHNVGVVHRDIKPANILMTGSAAVVADFGVAKALTAARDRQTIGNATNITGVGISLGTPQYMAPEQAAADPAANHRVDVYALGTVVYEMLTGAPPFHGRTPQSLLAAQLTELPMPIAARRYDVPVGLANLVMQCLEKNPDDRPRSALDIVRVLDSPEIISGPAAESPRAVRERRRRRVMTALYYGLPLIVGAAALWGMPRLLGGSSASTPSTTVAPSAKAEATAPNATRRPTVAIVEEDAIGEGSGDVMSAIVATLEPALDSAGNAVRIAPKGSSAPADSSLVLRVTVQRQGSRARASVRLTRGAATTALWSERFDFPLADSFAAQDSIASRSIRAITAVRGQVDPAGRPISGSR